MVPFADWLRSIGLERYEEALRQNDIDYRVVQLLSDNDLRDLGLTLGHRKVFLAAVAALGTAPLVRPSHLATPESWGANLGAERRHLTVMFCDLVGSVALSMRLDPEALQSLLKGYRTACSAVIERYAGHVAQYRGDGILTYFGWPQAHEEDAERAVRAALEIVQTLKESTFAEALSVHIGIATGPVVIGEDAGPNSDQMLAVGSTPNVAARLQEQAVAGQILIAPSTRRLVGSAFRLRALGERSLKGMAAPMELWAVEGSAGVVGRFEATHAQAVLTPLIGRDEELGLLLARWRLAREGEGQLVQLCGDAGIGKSRLTHRLREILGSDGASALSFHCSPYHANSPLFPVVEHLERVAGIQREDLPDQKLNKLEALLRDTATSGASTIGLFAALLSLPLDRYPSIGYLPQQQKDLTLAAILDFLETQASRTPLLLVFEDVHWMDSATQELLDQLAARLQQIAVLLIVTYRPEYTPPATGLGHVTTYALNRLSRSQAVDMVVQVGGGREWPPELIAQIVANADGVPLFVEELAKGVLESGLVRVERDSYTLTGPLSALAVPATLADSLMARLDRLAPVKELAQIGACIGREFPYALIAAVAGLPDTQMRATLDQLTQAQILLRQGNRTHIRYIFKHALIQEAAYQSLVSASRHRYHQRIAEALVAEFPEEVTARPEIVAFHFARAALDRNALDYWHRAGELAISRSAYAEAITHFTSALVILDNMDQNPERDRRELDIRVALGPAYQVIKGMSSPDAGRNYERACEIGSPLGRSPTLFRAVWGHWLYCNLSGRSSTARERAELLVSLGAELEDDEFALQALHARWTTFHNLGQLELTRGDIEEGLRLYDRQRHGQHAHIYGGHDPGVCARAQGGMCLWVAGFPDRANALADDGVALARELAHPFSLAVGLWFGGAVKLFRGDAAGCHAFAAELLALSRKRGFKSTEPHALFQLGWARMESGETAAGLELMEDGAERLRVLGQHGWRHFCLSTMAEARARIGDYERALALVNRAIEVADHAGIQSWRPEFMRQRAEWLLALRTIDRVAAREQLLAALEMARRQTARSIELKVSVSLARVLAPTAERSWAVEQLARCLAMFDQGAGTRDIDNANRWLTQLQG